MGKKNFSPDTAEMRSHPPTTIAISFVFELHRSGGGHYSLLYSRMRILPSSDNSLKVKKPALLKSTLFFFYEHSTCILHAKGMDWDIKIQWCL